MMTMEGRAAFLRGGNSPCRECKVARGGRGVCATAAREVLGPPPWQIPVFDHRALSPEGMIFKPTYSPTSDSRDLYHNILIGLDVPKGLNNGQPSALAYWIDALELKPGERVYHLGCGVGYYTAIIAEVVGSKGSVVASEVHAELGVRARENLAEYPNVKVEISEADCAPV